MATTSVGGVVKIQQGSCSGLRYFEQQCDRANAQSDIQDGGDYQLLQIPPAKYLITVTAPGFGSTSKEAELLVNQPPPSTCAPGEGNHRSRGGYRGHADIEYDRRIAWWIRQQRDDSGAPSEERNVPDLLSLQPGVFFCRRRRIRLCLTAAPVL